MDTAFVEIDAPEFREIAKAIRDYLRHEYAAAKLGVETNPVPMRISTYSGKGPGHYSTSPDGRADWTPEMERYIERSERRQSPVLELRFGFTELDRAMGALEKKNAQWHAVLVDVDVHGMSVDDYAARLKIDASTVKRRRKKATFELYRLLRLNPAHGSQRKVNVRTVKIS